MEITFEPHICVYLDVLGGATIFSNADKDRETAEEFLQCILDFENRLNGIRNGKKTVVKTFSDNIFAAIPIEATPTVTTEGWVGYFLHEVIQQIKMIFLLSELPIRGGVAIGNLFINDRAILGPAVPRAVHLEEKEAKYPRVVVDKNVLDLLPQFKGFELEEHPMIYRGEDNVPSLNYLGLDSHLLKKHGEIIQQKILEFANDERILPKYKWLEKYHLAMVERMAGMNLMIR
ncbi:hypothetical protein EJD96_16205 [Herbaspirillum seropedicae]|uniref:hypothetical protein n=1 Tax=Herbaspirillum seropedicae TaxID=964 RepID=UPI0011229C6A|nr:hypothetical protein [Herbaspirillum seropedicae]QDD65592.1 hypothetical protein EJD96_16205 [Herbaspirillum seropedicae]